MAWIAAVAALAAVEAVRRDAYVQAELDAFNSGLSPAKRKEKYEAMDADLFAFFRGTNHLYWKDLGQSANLATYSSASTKCWIVGDAHLANIGAFNNDQSTLVFDVNDFDETLVADYQLDVWRFGVSIDLMMRVNGITYNPDRDSAVATFTESYLDAIEQFAVGNGESALIFDKAKATGDLKTFMQTTDSSESRSKMLSDWTVASGSTGRAFKTTHPDLATMTTTEISAVKAQISSRYYGSTLSGRVAWSSSHFAVKSVAERLHAGIGSLGTKRIYVLIEGPSTSNMDDVILDIKAETTPSAFLNVAPAAVSTTNGATTNAGLRAVYGAQAMGVKVDDYLGWITLNSVKYFVRERNPKKKSFDYTKLTSLAAVTPMADAWGQILAAAHARSDIDTSVPPIAYDFDNAVFVKIDKKHDEFRALVKSVVTSYAAQVKDDYDAYKALRSRGVLSSEGGFDVPVASDANDDAEVIAAALGSVSAVLFVASALLVVVRRRRRHRIARERASLATVTLDRDTANPVFVSPFKSSSAPTSPPPMDV